VAGVEWSVVRTFIRKNGETVDENPNRAIFSGVRAIENPQFKNYEPAEPNLGGAAYP
jgi:hypothetical protein